MGSVDELSLHEAAIAGLVLGEAVVQLAVHHRTGHKPACVPHGRRSRVHRIEQHRAHDLVAQGPSRRFSVAGVAFEWSPVVDGLGVDRVTHSLAGC